MNKTEKFLGAIAINEKSFNRFLFMMENYDMAVISAWRREIVLQPNGAPLWSGYEEYRNTGKLVKTVIKEWANKELVRMLQNLKYGVIKVRGGYPKKSNTQRVQLNNVAHCFIVVNLNNEPNFHENLIKIATFFNQDTVGFVDKGDDALFYHIKTNDSSKRKPCMFKEIIGNMKDDEVIKEFFTQRKGYYLVVKKEYLKNLTSKSFYYYFDSGLYEMFEDEQYYGWQRRLIHKVRTYKNLVSLHITEAIDWNGRTEEDKKRKSKIAEENNAKTTRPERAFGEMGRF